MSKASGSAFVVNVQPTVTNGAYSAGDIVGGLLTFQLPSIAKFLLSGIQVAIKAAVTPSLTLVLFSADPSATTKTDNAAYSLNAADVFKVIGSFPVSTLYDHGTPNIYSNETLAFVVSPETTTGCIYGLLIDATGVTLTSTSDIQVTLRGISC